jgi:heme oxygenase
MKATAPKNATPASVVTALYLRTKDLHVEAERSGIIRDLLRGEASHEGYVLLMRNLLPVYAAMEAGMETHSDSHSLSEIASYRLDRTSAIESDLNELCGPKWSKDIPLLDAGRNYAQKMTEAAKGDGTKLIAHAYTRYLGDLSGGIILQKLLARSIGLLPKQLSFYNFPQFSDLAMLKSNYRQALDRAANRTHDVQSIIDEGAVAFALNIDLSWAVKNAVAQSAAAM